MTPIFVAHIEAKLTLLQRSPATPDSFAAKPPVCVWQSRMPKRVTLRVTDI
ncbi:hypothetical protein [Candidatus Spongiihabitans sp.]|uniref:hypothetical protein n=1 Tax=Candidatus Spongiihabitans sp. TaxID=3101308 RepID=UPI003C7BA1CD